MPPPRHPTLTRYGFATGAVCATAVCGVALAASHSMTIRPEAVYRAALRMVQRDVVVVDRLGSPIVSGELRAYRVDGGGWGLGPTRAPVWNPLRVQMIFDVSGERHAGLVTVESEKINGFMSHKLVGVDVLNDKDERVVVKGDEASLAETKEHLRSIISFKKVSKTFKAMK